MTMHFNPRKARGIMAVRADAGADLRGTIEELNRTVADFRATYDEKLNGKADVVLDEKVERINASVGDLQAAVDDANNKLAAIQMGAGTEPKVRNPEYSEAFLAHMRKGDVQASLHKGADAEGGYLAPVEWDRTITDQLIEVSPMRQIAMVQNISTAGFTKVFNLRGTASGWVGEQAARPETNTPTFGSMVFRPGEIYANPAATQQMLDDAEINLEQWLAMEVETEFAYQEGLAFIAGDGANKPHGFLTFVTGGANAATNPLGAIESVAATGTVNTLDEPDDLLSVVYVLPSAFTQGARWVMNRTTQGVVRKLKGQGASARRL